VSPSIKKAGTRTKKLPDGVRARTGRKDFDVSHIAQPTRVRNNNDRVLRGASLIWRRDGADWVLFSGRRRFGRVVPDSKYAGVWRSVLSGRRLSDRANLAWAKNAVLMAAERELEWEDRQRAAIAPPKCSERGMFLRAQPRPLRKLSRG
jgi:hypothetical protein